MHECKHPRPPSASHLCGRRCLLRLDLPRPLSLPLLLALLLLPRFVQSLAKLVILWMPNAHAFARPEERRGGMDERVCMCVCMCMCVHVHVCMCVCASKGTDSRLSSPHRFVSEDLCILQCLLCTCTQLSFWGKTSKERRGRASKNG